MLSNFSKIHKNSIFLASDIPLDRFETIKAVEGEEGDRNGLVFIVPHNEAWITNHWRRDGESQTNHFHVIFNKYIKVFNFILLYLINIYVKLGFFCIILKIQLID